MSRGVRWAYSGMVLGGITSIAANIAHALLPADPPAGSVLAAAFWPVALFVTVEILAKNAWPDERRWTLLRWGGTIPVAAVTAVVSYRHMSGLLTAWHEDPLTATIGPIAVDGLLLLSTGAVIVAGLPKTAPVAEVAATVLPVEPAPGQPMPPEHVEVTSSPVKPKHAKPPKPRPATDDELAEVIAAVLADKPAAGRPTVVAALKDAGYSPGNGQRLTDAIAAHKRQTIHAVHG